jgi:hypothetical protein
MTVGISSRTAEILKVYVLSTYPSAGEPDLAAFLNYVANHGPALTTQVFSVPQWNPRGNYRSN